LRGKILFVKSTTSEGIQAKLAEYCGVTAKDTPTLRLIQLGEDLQKFNFPSAVGEITTESVQAFIDDFTAGKLVAFQKSEPVPETNDGPVKKIVGTEWSDIVGDSTKDVFVKYYAPWCGHCKTLAPIWTELGQYVAGLNDVVIAEMDSTANEAKGVAVKSYPTLIYYPKNNKKGVAYSGDRNLDAFKTYLNDNSASYKAWAAGSSTTEKVQEEL
jgi:protein disulfide-isomerase A1